MVVRADRVLVRIRHHNRAVRVRRRIRRQGHDRFPIGRIPRPVSVHHPPPHSEAFLIVRRVRPCQHYGIGCLIQRRRQIRRHGRRLGHHMLFIGPDRRQPRAAGHGRPDRVLPEFVRDHQRCRPYRVLQRVVIERPRRIAVRVFGLPQIAKCVTAAVSRIDAALHLLTVTARVRIALRVAVINRQSVPVVLDRRHKRAARLQALSACHRNAQSVVRRHAASIARRRPHRVLR